MFCAGRVQRLVTESHLRLRQDHQCHPHRHSASSVKSATQEVEEAADSPLGQALLRERQEITWTFECPIAPHLGSLLNRKIRDVGQLRLWFRSIGRDPIWGTLGLQIALLIYCRSLKVIVLPGQESIGGLSRLKRQPYYGDQRRILWQHPCRNPCSLVVHRPTKSSVR